MAKIIAISFNRELSLGESLDIFESIRPIHVMAKHRYVGGYLVFEVKEDDLCWVMSKIKCNLITDLENLSFHISWEGANGYIEHNFKPRLV